MGRPATGARPPTDDGGRDYRRAMGRFASGVTVVTTVADDEIHGMTVNGFASVSIDPPLALVSLARSSRMHSLAAGAARYRDGRPLLFFTGSYGALHVGVVDDSLSV